MGFRPADATKLTLEAVATGFSRELKSESQARFNCEFGVVRIWGQMSESERIWGPNLGSDHGNPFA